MMSSEPKPRRQRRDKLPPEEKTARHLEASRNYYLRNKERIREEQRIRSRKYREKLREQKRRTESHPNTCSLCGQSIPAKDVDVGSNHESDEPEPESEEESLEELN